jgi:hypothetical protein
MHKKKRSNVRRRTNSQDLEDMSSSTSSFSEEQVWGDLLKHAWDIANTIKRDNGHSLSITTYPQEAYPSPFLVCTHGHHQHSHLHDTLALFDTQYEDYLVLSSSHEKTCLILSTTAQQSDQVMNIHTTLIAMPLVDISKIYSGTIDEVSSEGWTVPFHEGRVEDKQDSAFTTERKNETESMNEWERMITVGFVPCIGGMKEESQLLEVVNNMVGDILDMAEVAIA